MFGLRISSANPYHLLQGEDRGSSILCRDQGVGEDAQGENLKPGSWIGIIESEFEFEKRITLEELGLSHPEKAQHK